MTATDPDRLPIAVRAHTVRHETKTATATPTKRTGRRKPVRVVPVGTQPELVFDTETTTDETQALLFGCWRYYRVAHGARTCVQEGLFYADDLPTRDPVGMLALRRYAAAQTADTGDGEHRALELISQRAFIEQVFFKAAYDASARVIGFNLPFDLSRLAFDVAEGRNRNRGGFSFLLARGNEALGHAERRHRPRVVIKHVDKNRSFISFSTPLEAVDQWRGDFVDLKSLGFALTGRSHSLDSACRAFEVDGKTDPGEHGRITAHYIDYCRQDVRATAELYQAALTDLDRWNIDLPPSKAASPASIGKAVLAAMGVVPALERQPDLDPALIGRAMSAFYGGRAECRIRKTPVPVRLVDFVSTYTTLFALLDLWPLVIAERLEVVDVTDEVRDLVAGVTLVDCFDPELWPQIVGIALVSPDGDVLPVRAQYDPNRPDYGIGVNPLTSTEPLWYSIPDVIDAALLTGKAPRILRAERFVPIGQLPGLEPLTLPGGHTVDPRVENPFTVMIEHRQRIRRDDTMPEGVRERIQKGLKFTASAAAYGIFAEYNRQDLPIGDTVLVDVHSNADEPFTDRITAPEDPGRYSCPPLACVITGAARLLLGMLERCVTDAGGTWAFCDTDSMAIVATPRGGLIPCPGGPRRTKNGESAVRALPYRTVEAIRVRFEALNPYGRSAVPGSILNNELDAKKPQVWCYSIAAKRYALYRCGTDGLPQLVPAGEHDPCRHGLGHLMNPTDPDAHDRAWISQLWEHNLSRGLTGTSTPPQWFGRPALGRITITSWSQLRAMEDQNRGKQYVERVKPFNFLLFAPGAQPAPGPSGRGSFRLLAPFNSDGRKWHQATWRNQYEPAVRVRISTDPANPGKATVDTYRTVADHYFARVESKSSGPEGTPCARDTAGIMSRRSIQARRIELIGKEANRLEERQSGEIDAFELSQVLVTYGRPSEFRQQTELLDTLRVAGVHAVAQRLELSSRRTRDLLMGRSKPRSETLRRMVALANDLVIGVPSADDDALDSGRIP